MEKVCQLLKNLRGCVLSDLITIMGVSNEVRPAVYLTSAVQIIDGDGTESNPYQLGL